MDKIKPNLKRHKQKKSKSQPIRDSQFKRERDLLRLKYKERDSFWFINFISFFSFSEIKRERLRVRERVREKNLREGRTAGGSNEHRSPEQRQSDLRSLMTDL